MSSRDYQVIIIGGGPAGLTAGIYTARAGLRTILFEKKIPGGQILNTDIIENYPGFEGITGFELAQKIEKQARVAGLEIASEEVQQFKVEEGMKFVRTNKDAYRAPVVIICTGGEPAEINVPGEKDFWGKGVSYCAVCDGPLYRDKEVAVVGGGDAAVSEALFLTKYVNKVYLIHRRDRLRSMLHLQKRAFSNEKIEMIWNNVIKEIKGDDTVRAILLENRKTDENRELSVEGVFIYIGFRPTSEIFKEWIKTDKAGYIVTNEKMETSIPGIFAAGDIRAQLVRQITNAVGNATTAAIAAENYLLEKGFL
jgi:thioredoxin reductase (NADPH)